MKKSFKDLMNKSAKELEKEAIALRGEIIKVKVEMVSNPPKDSNIVPKKRRQLATVLTAFTQQKEAENFKNK